MPYEEDEVRRAARERLQARMERRGSASSLASYSNSRTNRPSQDGDANRRRGGGAEPDSGDGTATERRGLSERFANTRENYGSGNRARRSESASDWRSSREENAGTGNRRAASSAAGEPYHVEIGPLSFDLPQLNLPDFISPIAVPVAAIVVVLLLIFGLIVPSCTRSSAQPQSSAAAIASQNAPASSSGSVASAGAATAGTSSDAAQVSFANTGTITQKVINAKAKAEQSIRDAGQNLSTDTRESHQAALVELLGEETSAKLLAEARTSIDALWIAAHPGAYAFDGVEVQYKVLKLAADEPKALDYVREFPSAYPADTVNMDKSLAMSTSSPVSGVPDTSIPHLYQWDRRWGYTTYSGAAFGLTGCGPTSLAMVYQGITGKTDKTPYDMGKLADEMGYMSEYEGTVGTFFTAAAEQLGLYCEELWPDSDTLRNALEHGQTVILNLAPGYFTTSGHYFVVTGLADDGTAIVNDPYSVERSGQTWDLDLITSQSYIMYGYTRGN